MLELQGVAKQFGPHRAIEPCDLRIAAGATTVLIGPSGSGKSTLLRLMIGLTAPSSGAVTFDGAPVTRESAPAIRRRMGFVIQEGGLFPHLTARGNLSLQARYLGWDARRIAARIDELVRLTHFPPDGLNRYPAQLSGGQRQRVGLMRALMLDPDVLLLDEPLGALDPIIRAGLQDELREIFKALRKTVVLVTHDMGEAAFFAGTIALMRAGRILQKGSVADLLERPADPFVTQCINAQRSVLPAPGGSLP